jgi:hypothetical protein
LADPNLPIPDVCNLYKAKNNFLFKKYNDLGIFKIAIEKGWLRGECLRITKNMLNLIGETLNG